MADTKISGLTALTGANVELAADVLPIVDTSVTTTKKITAAELALAIARVTLGTPVAPSGTTNATFSSLPTGIRRITVNFTGISMSGTDDVLLQLSQSATFTTTGYVSAAVICAASSINSASFSSTSGVILPISSAATTASGRFVCEMLSSAANSWSISCTGAYSSGNVFTGHGSITMAGEVDGVRLIRSSADTFDAGAVNIIYER